MDQKSILEIAQQLNAMDLPFGSAFVVAGLAIYIFKQYLELKKQHLEIKAKLIEMGANANDALLAEGATRSRSPPVAEMSRDKRAGVYITAFVLGVLATAFRYGLSETFVSLASLGDTMQVQLWGSHGRQFGLWAYPTLALVATIGLFRNQIARRDFFVSTVLFTTILPLFFSTIAVLIDAIF